tara:strand:+ start:13286 stop:13405 length:120 start_codon:yes stop_codon:yes gene_type:complete
MSKDAKPESKASKSAEGSKDQKPKKDKPKGGVTINPRKD